MIDILIVWNQSYLNVVVAAVVAVAVAVVYHR